MISLENFLELLNDDMKVMVYNIQGSILGIFSNKHEVNNVKGNVILVDYNDIVGAMEVIIEVN